MTLNDLENTMVVKLRNGGLRYLKDHSLYGLEPIDDIVQDETIKELDEFGSKEVTFY